MWRVWIGRESPLSHSPQSVNSSQLFLCSRPPCVWVLAPLLSVVECERPTEPVGGTDHLQQSEAVQRVTRDEKRTNRQKHSQNSIQRKVTQSKDQTLSREVLRGSCSTVWRLLGWLLGRSLMCPDRARACWPKPPSTSQAWIPSHGPGRPAAAAFSVSTRPVHLGVTEQLCVSYLCRVCAITELPLHRKSEIPFDSACPFSPCTFVSASAYLHTAVFVFIMNDFTWLTAVWNNTHNRMWRGAVWPNIKRCKTLQQTQGL